MASIGEPQSKVARRVIVGTPWVSSEECVIVALLAPLRQVVAKRIVGVNGCAVGATNNVISHTPNV